MRKTRAAKNEFPGGGLLPARADCEECGGGGCGNSEKGHRATPLHPWRSIHPVNRPHCPLFSEVIFTLKSSFKTC